MAPMHFPIDLRSTKLKNVKFQKTFGWAAMKSLFHLRNSGRNEKKTSDIKERNHRSKDNILNPTSFSTTQSNFRHKQFLKSMKAVDLKKQSKLVAEGRQKQSSWIQTILGKIKIKRRVQNFKNLGKQLQLQQKFIQVPQWTPTKTLDDI